MLPLLLAGMAIDAAGNLMAGEAQKANAAYNAEIKRRNAASALQQGRQAEEALRRKTADFMATQRAAMAQSGTDPNSGSNADITYQSEVNAELDAMTVRYESQMRALGLTMEANQYESAGKEAQRAGRIGAGVSILSGIGNYQQSQLNMLGNQQFSAPMTQPTVSGG